MHRNWMRRLICEINASHCSLQCTGKDRRLGPEVARSVRETAAAKDVRELQRSRAHQVGRLLNLPSL